MKVVSTLYYLFIIFQLFSWKSNAKCNNNTKFAPNQVVYTITVSQSKKGDFNKIQQAIDSIPSGNDRWIKIYVNPGRYWEKVTIPYDKECIVLEGHSPIDTAILYNGNHEFDRTSSTFISSADNFVAKKISFINVYNNDENGKIRRNKSIKPALAASVYGDKSAFYNCIFIGYQDTLWDVSGRHYFKSCLIKGAVDFIWGNGQSYYEDCRINVCGDGFITAQGRTSAKDTSGFVFNGGFVYGSGQAFLGRAYKPYSRVIYQNTHFSHVVHPLGWDNWNVALENQITYAEVNCKGVGANKSGRVPWEKTLDESQLSKYTRQSFIDQEGWINQQP
ncbi:unnamed protein product [Amaranthus hypochondriacus]